MPTVKELMRAGRKEELWQMCCGFIDLTLEQFMAIQKRLLLEQIELLNQSVIGRKIFKGTVPQDVEEFRRRVPLTTYKDYCPELSEQRDDTLPAKPLYWQHSSGRSNEYPFKWENTKWVPMSEAFAKEIGKAGTGLAIFASCKRKGDVSGMREYLKFIYAVAPRPYTSGTFACIACDEVSAISLPSVDIAQEMAFEDRLKLSFKMALSQGFDYYFGLTVALVAIGEQINQQMGKTKVSSLLSQPKALFRILKGVIKAKMAGRKLVAGDLWPIKGVISSGSDVVIFRDLIKRNWGRYPLDAYISTEGGIIATQTWDYGSMTFLPNINFLEFVPESEYIKNKEDSLYMPKTILFDELKAGEKYELVITNFHGSPLMRYRTGDIIKITSFKNNNLNIRLPQMEFEGRIDYTLDIGGFIRLSEKIIWQAISNTGVQYVDWVARREHRGSEAILHIFIEPKADSLLNEKNLAQGVFRELKAMESGLPFNDINDTLTIVPVEVTLLPHGAFERYLNLRRSLGADLAHLKPPHINPSDKDLAILIPEISEVSTPVSKPVVITAGKNTN
jgi:hypothetical protein